MGLIAPPPGSSGLLRARGFLILLMIVIALLVVGFGLAQLVALPFGGASVTGAIFLGLAIVIVALVVLGIVGRRAPTPRPGESPRRPLRRLMCGRYTLATPDPAQIRAAVRGSASRVEVRTRFNVAPGDDVLAVVRAGGRPAGLLRWGLVPHWAKSPAASGSRRSTRGPRPWPRSPPIATRSQRRRCLIVADGFYEWRWRPRASSRSGSPAPTARRSPSPGCGPPGARRTTWSRCAPARSSPPRRPSALRELHDRMPVMLDAAGEEDVARPRDAARAAARPAARRSRRRRTVR